MKTDISIILDKRREKKNNTYPVKLRVYSPLLQKAKLYSTGLELTQKQFNSVWLTEKPRKIFQDDRDFLDAIRVKAVEAEKKTSPFSFDLFEKKLQRRKGEGKNLIHHYQQYIEELEGLGRYGTAESLKSSMKSVKDYLNSDKNKNHRKLITNIPFNKITPLFLKKYEKQMIESGKSKTTVGIYLRGLRTVFNVAIKENDISEDIYPFGKNKYSIPKGRAVKKALSKSQLKVLFNAIPATPEQQKAKDFWFLSFLCNGMNIKDIALLKNKNLNENTIKFERSKTEKTSDQQTITIVPLTEYSKSIIEKYRNSDKRPGKYVFSILDDSLSDESKHRKTKLFTRFVNQHIKLLAKANDLPEEISTYWARHSFATLAIHKGASMEFVQEAFGHGNISTTQNYFKGFPEETKKQINESLLNFD